MAAALGLASRGGPLPLPPAAGRPAAPGAAVPRRAPRCRGSSAGPQHGGAAPPAGLAGAARLSVLLSGAALAAGCWRGPEAVSGLPPARRWRRVARLRRAVVAQRAAATAGAAADNDAVVFVKPHACTPATLELVPRTLEERGVSVVRSGSVTAAEIESGGIIDAHYAAIARVGMSRDIRALGLGAAEAAKFLAGYGRELEEALAAGAVYSAATAMEALDVDPSELLSRCLAAGYEKLGSGLYCAKLEGRTGATAPEIYVLNGFYARMREKFTASGVVVHWFQVRFDEKELPWATFRQEVIGSTNPPDAAAGSLRALIRDGWQDLGLKEETNYQDNGVHASAGPLEALRERTIWLGQDPEADPFAVALAAAGGPPVRELIENPEIDLGGERGSAFDLLEDVDSSAALERLASCKLA